MSASLPAGPFAVRGSATPEELAAVLAAIAQQQAAREPDDGLARWRRVRRSALRDNR